MRTQCVLKVAHTPRCPQQQDKRKSGGRKEEDNGVCHLRAFGLNENLSARIKLYCIQNYSNYSTNNYGRRSRSSASDFVFFFWCFFLGVSKWGKHFIMRFLRHFGLSALQFPLPVLFCAFCFVFFFVFSLPFSCCAFSPAANSFFPLKLHSPCFFSGLWSVYWGRESGISTEKTNKGSNKTGNP